MLDFFFLHAISACQHHKMHHRGALRPPMAHFMLPTNKNSVQKK